MKTVIIVSHPVIQSSSMQQFLMETVTSCKEEVVVRHIDTILKQNNTGHFDKQVELAVIQEANRIIFQFPFYWYSCPAVMKQWIDEVMDHKLIQQFGRKQFGIVTAVGVSKDKYVAGGREQFTIDELLRPFQALACTMGWEYLPVMAIHQFTYMTELEKQLLLVDYLRYVTQENLYGFEAKERWFIAELEKSAELRELSEYIQQLQEERQELDLLLSGWEE